MGMEISPMSDLANNFSSSSLSPSPWRLSGKPKKLAFKEAGKVNKEKKVQEMLLFHGTDAANINSIFREGFKVNFEPKHKTKMNLYGRGIYMAEHPELAFAYSKHENNQGNTLLLCKVAFCTLNFLNISFPGGAWQSADVRSHTSTFPG